MNEETLLAQEAAANPFSNFSLSGILAPGGILNKAADTAIDLYALRESGRIVGSVYPSGQVDPASVNGRRLVSAPPANYTPWILGGVAVVGLVLLVTLTRK